MNKKQEKNNIFKTVSIFKKDKPISYFLVSFVLLSIFFIVISPYFISAYRDIFLSMGTSYFDSNINNDYKLQRSVRIIEKDENQTEIQIQTIFYDKPKPDGSFPMKYIGVDIINEGFIPTALIIILTFATPVDFRRKLLSVLVGFIVFNLYIQFKLFAMAFDNYNSPEFVIKQLSFPIDSFVYYYNYLLNISGYSLNFVMVIIIWLLATLRLTDIEKIVNSN